VRFHKPEVPARARAEGRFRCGLAPFVSGELSPEYLLFLKRGKDGRYEPVSGRIDPILSVREMCIIGRWRKRTETQRAALRAVGVSFSWLARPGELRQETILQTSSTGESVT
jgi:hypothetical protein